MPSYYFTPVDLHSPGTFGDVTPAPVGSTILTLTTPSGGNGIDWNTQDLAITDVIGGFNAWAIQFNGAYALTVSPSTIQLFNNAAVYAFNGPSADATFQRYSLPGGAGILGTAANTGGLSAAPNTSAVATWSTTAFTVASGINLIYGGVTLPAISKDTGWIGNADSGSKTAVIPAAATLSTIATAMNLAVAGSGDALAATAAKVKAIEAALALTAPLLPNA